MKIVGLGHYSRTGKDTLAGYILSACKQRGLNAKRVGFADEVKVVSQQLYGWAGLKNREFYDRKENEHLRDRPLPLLSDLTPVDVWVAVGNKMREVYPHTWIEKAMDLGVNDSTLDILIISDVRFPNECEAIKGEGGNLVKVVRPGYGPKDTASDRALLGYSGWDYIIGGSGELIELMLFADKVPLFHQNEYWVPQDLDERTAALTVEMEEVEKLDVPV